MKVVLLATAVVAGVGLRRSLGAEARPYIVPSIDLAKKQILLKRPTEVTESMRVDGETRYFEENGKPMRLADLCAGDTVFIMSKPAGGQSIAVTIHKGPMTLDVLRQPYLKGAK